MRIRGNRGVRLPDFKVAVLSRGIETPPAADRLYIPIPEERLDRMGSGEKWTCGQFLWENDYRLPVYCPADGVVEDVVRLNHPLFGDGCYVVLSQVRYPRRPMLFSKDIQNELSEKARAAAILDEIDGVPLFMKLQGLRDFGGTLVADATAADPYMAASAGVLAENPELVLRGLQLAAEYTGAARYGVAVTPGADGGRRVRSVLRGHVYRTGRQYPVDRLAPRFSPLPIAVMGVQALAALARAADFGEIADTCVVTIHGDRVFRPRNLRVRNGTLASHLLRVCEAHEPELLVLGGVMTGTSCANEQIPVSAGVTCLLAMAKPKKRPVLPCIGCDACIRVCHRQLIPCEIARLLGNMQYDRLPELHAQRCDGCGACSYVCPAGREVAAAVLEAKNAQGTIFMDLEGG